MHRFGFLPAAFLAAAVATASATAPAADNDYRLTGPYTRGNLSIYLIHRENTDRAPVPLALGEAMEQDAVEVVETGTVEELVIRNTGDRAVFIQAGDIVKGGKQDRVLTASMILPPHSGDIAVGAFCVERGRWSARGLETMARFSASTARLPSKAGRMALYYGAHRTLGIESDSAERALAGGSLQNRIWASVAETQAALSGAIKREVADERSRSSLQLSLENPDLALALGDYEAALGRLAQDHADAVGYVFAVDGRLDGGDEFDSAGLFRKLWARQLRAAATQATVSTSGPGRGLPTLAEVSAFIDSARSGDAVVREMPGGMSLEARESQTALYTEMRRPQGFWFHRAFIAR